MSASGLTESIEKRLANLEFRFKMLAILVGLLVIAAFAALVGFPQVQIAAVFVAVLVGTLALIVCICESASRAFLPKPQVQSEE